MKPIVFGGRFGWLHPGKEDRGVILCNSFGHEYVWTHKGMRHLADELSARGIWVLRFDYRGSGDSAGADGASDQFDTAVADVGDAITWLRQETGVTHVTLCGMRLGAAFALLAARQCPVDALALLAPVVSGRSYMRELSVVYKTWFDQLVPFVRAAQPLGGLLNVLGQVYSKELQAQLGSIDLAASLKDVSNGPSSRALIVHTRAAACELLRARLAALGVEVDSQPFDDYTSFFQETAFSVIPMQVFKAAVEWMAGGLVADVANMSASRQIEWDEGLALETAEAIERPVRVGVAGMFGVLCEPRRMVTGDSVLLITNTSANAHVGDSRLSVRMAREMARLGIASLRFDCHGIGDSPSQADAVSTQSTFDAIYSTATTDDVAAAAAWLKGQGYRNVVSFGICSGAYSALRAALVEPALSGAIAVNLPSFHMQLGVTRGPVRWEARNSMAGYADSILDVSKWKRIVTGERSLKPVLRVILSYAAVRMRSCAADLIRFRGDASFKDGPPTDPRDMMRVLQRKGVHALLIYGAYDAGLDILTEHFGKHGKRLERYAPVRVEVIDDIDHSLFNADSSVKVFALSAELIKGLASGRRRREGGVGSGI
jgi:pimeloyl-ACP methyl ester carboxylesterase